MLVHRCMHQACKAKVSDREGETAGESKSLTQEMKRMKWLRMVKMLVHRCMYQAKVSDREDENTCLQIADPRDHEEDEVVEDDENVGAQVYAPGKGELTGKMRLLVCR